MPVHPFRPPRGRIETITIESAALAGNLLGDPTTREVAIYLPAGYDAKHREYPLFVSLAGFTGSGLKQLAWRAFGESLPQRLDRLLSEGRMGEVVLALPDAFTSLGGNQYVNSAALGRWEDFLLEEMLPRIEGTYRVRRDPHGRAVFGHSSGGYGALIQALRHGEHWGAMACHAGDIGFDVLYRRDLPGAVDVLARHDGSVERFLSHLRSAREISGGEMQALMVLAMAASYDPDPEAPFGVSLPLDLHTAELDPTGWARWLEHDPLELVERPACRENLKRLRVLYLDCGTRDPYFCHYGARAFVRRLERHGIPHVYEEFDGEHTGNDHRLDRSLPLLYGALET